MAHQGARHCCGMGGSFALNAAWMFEIALALLSRARHGPQAMSKSGCVDKFEGV